jgi:PAS domain S-box-containing protein
VPFNLRETVSRLDQEIAALRQLAATGDGLLLEVARVARKMIGARYAAIHVVENGRVEDIVQDGLTDAEAAAMSRLPTTVGLFALVAASEAPIRIRDARGHPMAIGVPADHPSIRSLLAVPMIAGSERYGYLYLGNKVGNDEFTAIDEQLAEMFAIHGAIAIRDARQRAARVVAEGQQARMASALAQSSDGVFILDPDTTVAYANEAGSAMYGHAATDLLGRMLTVIDSGIQGAAFFADLYGNARAGHAWTGAVINRHRDGTLVHAEVSITPMLDAGGALTGIIESHRDVTARVAAERERERLVSAIEQAPDPIWILEPDGTVAYVNAAVTRLYGYAPAELVGGQPSILDGGVESPAFWVDMWAKVRNGRPWSGTVMNRTKGGTLVQIESTISPVIDAERHVSAIIAADRDVTRERALESDLERLARERDSIEAALHGIDPSAAPEEIAAAACAEIVRLSDVGSAAVFDLTPGAEMVLGLAGRMSTEMRAGEPIPELVAATLRDRSAPGPWIHDVRADPIASQARVSAKRTGLQTVAYAPFSSPNGTFGIIGIGNHDPKTAGRFVERLSALTMFGSILGAMLGPGLDRRHRGSKAQAQVRRTLERSAFTPHFQPIVELGGGKVVGYEALTRFTAEQDPTQAFAAAARAGLGVDLEAATLAAALEVADALPPDAYLSLNASPAFINSGKLAELLVGQARRLVLEITEHVAIADYPAIRRSIELLGPNIRLAVDDAGAGFASFRHILELAPDFVKLDIGLVRGIDADPARQALAAGMVFFATERKLVLIAEGIETREELQTLRHLGVQLGQGYLLGRPQAMTSPRRRRKSRPTEAPTALIRGHRRAG